MFAQFLFLGIYVDIEKCEIQFGLNGNFYVEQGVAFSVESFREYVYPCIKGSFGLEIDINMSEPWIFGVPKKIK